MKKMNSVIEIKLDRDKERAKFLQEHFTSEITKLIKEYLLAMSDIDKTEAAAVLSAFLDLQVALT